MAFGQSAEPLYSCFFGHAALTPQPQALAADTLFDLASLTKPVATATSVLVLLDRGSLRLDDAVAEALPGWRAVVADAVRAGLPVPAYAAALTFYDGYRSEVVPANLVQAQRDYFGAHTYERVDRPRGEWFHTDWTGEGGDATSGSYEA